MHDAYALVITSPSGACQVFIGDEDTCRRARGEIVNSWTDLGPVYYLEPRGGFRAPDGRTLFMIGARQMEQPTRCAVVLRDENGEPMRAYLFGDPVLAGHAAATMDGNGIPTSVVDSRPLTDSAEAAAAGRDEWHGPLGHLISQMSDFQPISSALSDQVCPRCQDGMLRVETALNARDRLTGELICSGCAWLADLKAA